MKKYTNIQFVWLALAFMPISTIAADYATMSKDELHQALISAVERNKADVVKELIQAGADINQNITYSKSQYDDYDTHHTCTLLEYAAQNDKIDVTKELLRAHSALDVIDQALIAAVKAGTSPVMVKELLQAKPKMDAFSKALNTMKKFFGAGYTIDVMDKALVIAATNGDISIMQELIAAGADVHYADEHGNTALIKFVGRSVHIRSEYTRNEAYIERCKEHRKEGLQVLLQAQAYVNHANKYGNTALIRAVESCNLEAVQILVQTPYININHANKDGNTALIRALQCVSTSYIAGDVNQYLACKNSQKIVELLLQHPDIDAHHANNKGTTAVQLIQALQKEARGY